MSDAAAPLPEPRTPAEPRCALFGACGGCQLQHVPYDEQLAWKTAEVRRLFAELWPGAEIDVAPCVGSPRAYGYRSKLTPHFPRPRRGEVPPIGFVGVAMPRRTIDVPSCPLATDAINARLTEVRADIVAHLASYRLGSTLLLRDAASGITTDQREIITEEVGDLRLQFRAGDFFQNNPFLLPALAAHVAAEARAAGARFLLDAYCGSGLLALAAAPGFERVVGVETSPTSVAWARENAAAERPRQLHLHARRREPHLRRPPVPGRGRRRHRRPATQGLRARVPRPARRLRAAHRRLRLVQPRDAGARPRAAPGRRPPGRARPAVRHVPADAPPRVRRDADARR